MKLHESQSAALHRGRSSSCQLTTAGAGARVLLFCVLFCSSEGPSQNLMQVRHAFFPDSCCQPCNHPPSGCSHSSLSHPHPWRQTTFVFLRTSHTGNDCVTYQTMVPVTLYRASVNNPSGHGSCLTVLGPELGALSRAISQACPFCSELHFPPV